MGTEWLKVNRHTLLLLSIYIWLYKMNNKSIMIHFMMREHGKSKPHMHYFCV